MGRMSMRSNRNAWNPSRMLALAALLFAAVPLGGCEDLDNLLGDVQDETGGEEEGSSGEDAAAGDEQTDDGEAAVDEADEMADDGVPADGSEEDVDEIGTSIAAEEGSGALEDGEESDDVTDEAADSGEHDDDAAVDARLFDSAAADDDDGTRMGVDMLSSDELLRAERLAFEGTLVGDELSAATDRDSVLTALSDEGATGGDAATRVAALADRPSYRVLYTQRVADKNSGSRAAEVAIYRYDTGEPVFTRVDLETGDVSAMEVPAGMPVPLVRGEIDEAALIALADPEVAERLESAGISPDGVGANGLLTRSSEDGSACNNRCVRLFLTSLEMPVPEFAVIVDLVTLTVLAIEDMPGRNLNP